MKYILCLPCAAMLILCVVIFLNPQREIIKVELARSGAWSDRGGAVSVDNSLKYNLYYTYLGAEDKPASGYYVGEVSRKFWDTLTTKLQSIDLESIPEMENRITYDVNYFELIVTYKDGKRRIVRDAAFNKPDSLDNFISWLDYSYKSVHFSEKVDSIKFETTYQAGGRESYEKKFFEAQEQKIKQMNTK